MAHDVPKIRLDDTYKIKILICYILHNIGCPLTESQIVEIATTNDMVNYFDLQLALNDIDKNRLCTVKPSDNGEICYSIDINGKSTVEQFESHVPLSIREKSLDIAIGLITRIQKEKESYDIKINETNKGFYVDIKFFPDNPYIVKLETIIQAETREKAEKIKTSIDNNPMAFYKQIMNYTNK